ncbi:MAG: hypothetical protein ACOY3L_03705 [Pseudomonadota bacterium]
MLDFHTDVPAAMYRSDVGEITFNYGVSGDPKRDFAGGSGLSHIRDKRTIVDAIDGDRFARETIPEAIAYGRLVQLQGPPTRRRAIVIYRDVKIILSLHRTGQRETWIVTGYTR